MYLIQLAFHVTEKSIVVWIKLADEWQASWWVKLVTHGYSLEDDDSRLFSACFFVNSSAFFKNFFLSFKNSSARSALKGCSGSGSFTNAIRACTTVNQLCITYSFILQQKNNAKKI